jgi:hypothetical protein
LTTLAPGCVATESCVGTGWGGGPVGVSPPQAATAARASVLGTHERRVRIGRKISKARATRVTDPASGGEPHQATVITTSFVLKSMVVG